MIMTRLPSLGPLLRPIAGIFAITLFLDLTQSAMAQDLPPGRDRDFTCPSCECAAATFELLFDAEARDEAAIEPPEQCLWSRHREEGHMGEPVLRSSIRNFSKKVKDAGTRETCRRLGSSMVEHVRSSGGAYCATDIAPGNPAAFDTTLAHCDQDSFMTWTILDQDGFISAVTENTEIDPAACPVAKQLHIAFWVTTRLEAMAWLEEGEIVENLATNLRIEPGIAQAVAHILQHGEVNPPQQKRALPIFEAVGRKDLIEGRRIARLTDEVLKGEGKRQRYGTFFSCEDGKLVPSPPLETPELVNERRTAIGFTQTIEEQIESYGNRCAMEQQD